MTANSLPHIGKIASNAIGRTEDAATGPALIGAISAGRPTVWSMMHRIRAAMVDDGKLLSGLVEMKIKPLELFHAVAR